MIKNQVGTLRWILISRMHGPKDGKALGPLFTEIRDGAIGSVRGRRAGYRVGADANLRRRGPKGSWEPEIQINRRYGWGTKAGSETCGWWGARCGRSSSGPGPREGAVRKKKIAELLVFFKAVPEWLRPKKASAILNRTRDA